MKRKRLDLKVGEFLNGVMKLFLKFMEHHVLCCVYMQLLALKAAGKQEIGAEIYASSFVRDSCKGSWYVRGRMFGGEHQERNQHTMMGCGGYEGDHDNHLLHLPASQQLF